MQRVFVVEVLRCLECGGSTRIIADIHPPDTTGAILECLGLPARGKRADRSSNPPYERSHILERSEPW